MKNGLFYRMEDKRCACMKKHHNPGSLDIEEAAMRELTEDLPGVYDSYRCIISEGPMEMVMRPFRVKFVRGIASPAGISVAFTSYPGASDYWLSQLHGCIAYDDVDLFVEAAKAFSKSNDASGFYFHMFRRESWKDPGIMRFMRERESGNVQV